MAIIVTEKTPLIENRFSSVKCNRKLIHSRWTVFGQYILLRGEKRNRPCLLELLGNLQNSYEWHMLVYVRRVCIHRHPVHFIRQSIETCSALPQWEMTLVFIFIKAISYFVSGIEVSIMFLRTSEFPAELRINITKYILML